MLITYPFIKKKKKNTYIHPAFTSQIYLKLIKFKVTFNNIALIDLESLVLF